METTNIPTAEECRELLRLWEQLLPDSQDTAEARKDKNQYILIWSREAIPRLAHAVIVLRRALEMASIARSPTRRKGGECANPNCTPGTWVAKAEKEQEEGEK